MPPNRRPAPDDEVAAVEALAGKGDGDERCRRIVAHLLPMWLDELVPEDAPHRLPPRRRDCP